MGGRFAKGAEVIAEHEGRMREARLRRLRETDDFQQAAPEPGIVIERLANTTPLPKTKAELTEANDKAIRKRILYSTLPRLLQK
jgi:hypothetical protein